MKLCLEVGRLDVNAAMAEISSVDFSRWKAFARLFPFGDSWRPAMTVAAMVLNARPGVTKFFTADDFMPTSARPKRTKEAGSLRAAIKALAAKARDKPKLRKGARLKDR